MNQSFVRQSGLLTLAVFALWAVLAYPAILLAGTRGVEGLSIAALLCLMPGWLVFGFLALNPSPNQQALAVLFGTVLRLFVVVLGMWVVMSIRRDFTLMSFQVWIAVFYLETLAVETHLVVKQASTSAENRVVESNGEAA
ncbi:MAG: hypothetical protein CMJ78_26385 [Planctomycetaceae bacterium]|nr:hypothetical protein [Planctomycetaceae bacterium]